MDWQAIEAIGVCIQTLLIILGGIALIPELKARREERIERNYITLLSILENFLNLSFLTWINNILEDFEKGWPDEGRSAEPFIIYCLGRLNIVQMLIEKNLLDQNLLFFSVDSSLFSLASAVKNFEIEVAQKRPIKLDIRQNFKRGHKFLKNYQVWSQNFHN